MTLKKGTVAKLDLISGSMSQNCTSGIYLIIDVLEDGILATKINDELNTIYTINNDCIKGVSSARLSKEARDVLKSMYKIFQEEMKNNENIEKINKANIELWKQRQVEKKRLYDAMEIYSFDDFVEQVVKECNIPSTWKISRHPCPYYCYSPSENNIFFLEESVVEYNNRDKDPNGLSYQMYDDCFAMKDNYTELDAYKVYKRENQRKLLTKLPLNNSCYVSDKGLVKFVNIQELPTNGIFNKDLIKKIQSLL